MNINHTTKKDLTLHYVYQLLKRFNIIVYTGNRLDDIAIMELELEDLIEWKLITDEEFIHAKRILIHYANQEKKEKEMK